MITRNGAKRAVPVSLMNLNTGEVITFGSGVEAAAALGCTPSEISQLRTKSRRRVKDWVLTPGVAVQRASQLRAPVHLTNLDTGEVMRFDSCKAADSFLGCRRGLTSDMRNYRRERIGPWTIFEDDE